MNKIFHYSFVFLVALSPLYAMSPKKSLVETALGKKAQVKKNHYKETAACAMRSANNKKMLFALTMTCLAGSAQALQIHQTPSLPSSQNTHSSQYTNSSALANNGTCPISSPTPVTHSYPAAPARISHQVAPLESYITTAQRYENDSISQSSFTIPENKSKGWIFYGAMPHRFYMHKAHLDAFKSLSTEQLKDPLNKVLNHEAIQLGILQGPELYNKENMQYPSDSIPSNILINARIAIANLIEKNGLDLNKTDEEFTSKFLNNLPFKVHNIRFPHPYDAKLAAMTLCSLFKNHDAAVAFVTAAAKGNRLEKIDSAETLIDYQWHRWLTTDEGAQELITSSLLFESEDKIDEEHLIVSLYPSKYF